jgi:methylglyoxal/glyoxal reductase
MVKNYTLHNGVQIPALGFGTFKIDDGPVAVAAVSEALRSGYRHIDTASVYGNEIGVGMGIRESGIPREDIFLTSKVWNSDQGYDSTLRAYEASLERLGTDYLDLYLIHWPKPVSTETWKALERLYAQKSVRAVGVCNFTIRQFDELLEDTDLIPMVNQVELHPQFPQYELMAYCRAKGVLIESWGPLMQGRIFSLPLIGQLAERYHCTAAQFALAWQFQMGNIALVKSIHRDRIKENMEVPDITISQEDLSLLSTIEGQRIGPDPERINF